METKMTKERYLKMCDQMGMDPNPDEMPPGWEDLPEIVQKSINIFNILGDRSFPDVGYLGKDYTNLPLLIEIYEIEEKEMLVELLSWLDSRVIKKSSERIKQASDKLKNKQKGAGISHG